MKSSIIIAVLILLGVLGWVGSGQLTNIKAKAENKDNNNIKQNIVPVESFLVLSSL